MMMTLSFLGLGITEIIMLTVLLLLTLVPQLFASKYLPYLPTEEELAAEIEREKRVFREEVAYYGKKEE